MGARLTRVMALTTGGRLAVWLIAPLAVVGIVVSILTLRGGPAPLPEPVATASPSETPTAIPTTATPRLTLGSAVAATVTPVPPTATAPLFPPLPLTPAPGGQLYLVTPTAQGVGWVREGDKAAHFGDYNIYAGVFDGQAHLGAMQFDLSPIPRGAPVLYADLTLTGLQDQFLGSNGQWTVQLLTPEMDLDWRLHSFTSLSRSDASTVNLQPALTVKDLAAGRPNSLVLDDAALQALNDRALRGVVSFRIQGPMSGANNMFAWDSGYGARTQGRGPMLRLVTGPAPEKPPATPTPNYVIITATPTPQNILTVAALAMTGTAQAQAFGTPTPLPPHWVTPLVLVPTETPANEATAAWYVEVATAQAFFGTATPLPPNVWTATPKPPPSPTPPPPPPTQPVIILVTPAPTPANIVTAAAVARAATAQALRVGTPTPGARVITLRIVTNTPTPGNEATAAWQMQVATAEAFLNGTPVPRAWVITTTPVPALQPVTEAMIPTATPQPTGLPAAIPDYARGKIAFLSDRFGGSPAVLVMDPDGGQVTRPSEPWIYQRALQMDSFSPDNLQRVIVRNRSGGTELALVNTTDGWATRLIDHGNAVLYDPSWSPVAPQIAFVSNVDQNDEIYVIDKDTKRQSRLTNNQWAWDKHPSWSPDGQQIVFWSNRDTGRKQIWVMNADGSQPRNLSSNEFNDWDPVWLK